MARSIDLEARQAASPASHTRILGLGNEILADDAFGIVAARRLQELGPPGIDVVVSSESGLHLLDYVAGASRLIVIDTVQTGRAEPGTIYVLREEDVRGAPGCSLHYIGLFETLALGRKLGLAVPREVTVIAVEPADCLTVGGPMDPRVEAAIGKVVGLVLDGSALA